MARTVGATADELSAAGREDAASQLRTLEQDRDLRQRIAAVPGLGALAGLPLPGADNNELLPLIAAGLDAIDTSGLPAAARRELTAMFVGNLLHDAARRYSELLLMLRIATGDGLPS